MAEAMSDAELDAWVREFCEARGMSMDDPRLYQAAWVLAGDKPNHPLCQWAARQRKERRR